jgi:hypothetical protein
MTFFLGRRECFFSAAALSREESQFWLPSCRVLAGAVGLDRLITGGVGGGHGRQNVWLPFSVRCKMIAPEVCTADFGKRTSYSRSLQGHAQHSHTMPPISLSLWAPTPSLVAVHGVLVAARTAEQRWSATPAGPRGKGGEGRLYWREERTGDRGGGREPVGGGVEDASEWSARATFMAGG